MSLVSPTVYTPLFEPLRHARVGFVSMRGNAGDHMIDDAARQLFRYFGINYRDLSPSDLAASTLPPEVDEIVVSGGGNLGRFYGEPYGLRQAALSHGLPVTVFPQSVISVDEDLSPYKTVYAREHISQSLHPGLRLTPDLALALTIPGDLPAPECGNGLFLRRDVEARFRGHADSLPDPVATCPSPHSYIRLAARFEHVISDRLHFCIAALLAGRRATLLPNSYHKNEAMFSSWLEELGCEWSDTPPRIDENESARGLTAVVRQHVLETGLSLPPAARARLLPGWNIQSRNEQLFLVHAPSAAALRINESALSVLELCESGSTMARMMEQLSGRFPETADNVNGDVRELLCLLTKHEVIDFEWSSE